LFISLKSIPKISGKGEKKIPIGKDLFSSYGKFRLLPPIFVVFVVEHHEIDFMIIPDKFRDLS